MHIDELIRQLEELRSKHEDLHVYYDDPTWGWEDFSLEIIRRGINDGCYWTPIEEETWVGIR